MGLGTTAIAEPLRLNTTFYIENFDSESLQLQMHLSAPEKLLQYLPHYTDKIIQSQFINAQNPAARHYRLEMESAGDRFALLLYWPRPNILKLKVEDNWIPADWILGEVKEALDPVLKKLEKAGLVAQMQSNSEGLQVQFSQAPVAGYWSSTGDLWLSLPPPLTKPSATAATPPPVLTLKAKLELSQLPPELNKASAKDSLAPNLSASLAHSINVQLSEDQTKNLTLSEEKIYSRLEALIADLNGSSSFKGSLAKDKLTGTWQGQFQANIESLKVKNQTYTGLRTYPFHWRWQWPYQRFSDFEVSPKLPPLPALVGKHQPEFSSARLQYTIDGPIYLKSLREAVARARYRVQQEVFVFYPGESTEALSRLYWLKAAGLQEKQNQLMPDTYAPEGIPLEIMHNHLMSPEGAAEVSSLFQKSQSDLLQQLKAQGFTPTDINKYNQRMQHHLQLRALSHGIIKINHRKQVIIDNSLAFVGGSNMADHYLTEQSFHDIMYQLTGPVIKPLQQAFAHNWNALAPGVNPLAPSMRPTTSVQDTDSLSTAQASALMTHLPRSHKDTFYTPQVALLLYDHDQNTIKPALLQLIHNAKHTLRLEQAYVTEQSIINALKSAKARGVNLELVMSHYNDETMFERLNIASMLTLHEAPGSGKVETWLYRGHDKAQQTERTNPSYMVHSKYISADGKEAIVGSTNLVSRSLQSPFYGLLPEHYTHSPALFNEELGLWIKDRHTVMALDRDLVRHDQNTRSQRVSASELQRLLSTRGGQWQLLGDRLKALFG